MARILLTVCGVGFGHASRAEIVIRHLEKKHVLAITSYNEGFEYLKKDFPKTEKLEWFRYYFNKNRIARAKTILFNTPKIPFVAASNFLKLQKIIKEFKPDLIVSDFDSNGLYAGKIFGLPVILVSNMHLSEHFSVPLKFTERVAFELTDKMMLRAYFGADYYLITSIMKPKAKKPNQFFFHPIVRESLLKEKPADKKFFLVYASLKNFGEMLTHIRKISDERFVVYGYGKKSGEKNIVFREFSKEQWQADMKNCSGFFCNGGLLATSEAVILKKPVYVTATVDWFERFHNGKMVEALGFGKMEETPTKNGAREFIEKNAEYKKKLKQKNIKPANKEFFEKMDELIESLS